MFKRLDDNEALSVRFRYNGKPVFARRGESIAAALLGAGHEVFRRSAVSHSPRGPYCMMGGCFECLISIDNGAPVQACMTSVREGIEVRSPDMPVGIAEGTTP